MEASTHHNGWIILCLILMAVIIVLLIAWFFTLNNCENQLNGCTQCYGPYGVQSNIDALGLNVCGTNRTDPCTFAVNSLLDCEQICDVWSDVCTAFTYNTRTATMNIVDPTNTFASSDQQTNLFVQQAGKI